MKTIEVRIGNFCNLKNKYFDETGQISSINPTTVRFDLKNGNESLLFLCEHIKPIPLTEKWLLDFGFKKLKDDRYVIGKLEKPCYRYKLECWKDEDNKFRTVYGNIIILEYVHQLQNLFFALTGTELEYNPK